MTRRDFLQLSCLYTEHRLPLEGCDSRHLDRVTKFDQASQCIDDDESDTMGDIGWIMAAEEQDLHSNDDLEFGPEAYIISLRGGKSACHKQRRTRYKPQTS